MTQSEIEALAVLVANAIGTDWRGLIAHLSDADAKAVCKRAADIAEDNASTCVAASAELEGLNRLAKAAGCPPNVAVIPWLTERGLIVNSVAGPRIVKAN